MVRTLAHVSSAVAPVAVVNQRCHYCRTVCRNLIACSEGGRHRWCANCVAEVLEVGGAASRAPSGTHTPTHCSRPQQSLEDILHGVVEWKCPACANTCTCTTCRRSQGHFPGLRMSCEYGGVFCWPAESLPQLAA